MFFYRTYLHKIEDEVDLIEYCTRMKIQIEVLKAATRKNLVVNLERKWKVYTLLKWRTISWYKDFEREGSILKFYIDCILLESNKKAH